MKYRWLRRILILAAAAALCVAMTRVSFLSRKPGAGSLTLWYAESECPRTVMEALAALCHEETGLIVEARGYADETALGHAFEGERPDLVFCSHVRAAGFGSRASLGEEGASLPLPDSVRAVWTEIGRSFFPLGGRLPLLLVNTALTGADYENLEALLAAAGEEPFLASDDWSELLYTAMSAQGKQMWGDPVSDGRNRVYRALYNELAEAAFRGALVTTAEAAEHARQGLVPCAVVRSTELAGLTDKNLAVRPLPLPEGGQPRYPAELMGFALPAGADTKAVGSFLNWLYTGARAAETALAAGLVPVAGEANAKTPVGTALLELSRSGAVSWPAPDTAFYRNRDDCERRLSRALALLA